MRAAIAVVPLAPLAPDPLLVRLVEAVADLQRQTSEQQAQLYLIGCHLERLTAALEALKPA